VTYKPSKRAEIYARVRTRHHQLNAEGSQRAWIRWWTWPTNYRFNASYSASQSVTLRTRIESVDYQRGDSPQEHGFLIYQDVSIGPCAAGSSSPDVSPFQHGQL